MWTVNFKVKETGHLTWALRKKSFSLIVFDESHEPYSCGRLLIKFHLGGKTHRCLITVWVPWTLVLLKARWEYLENSASLGSITRICLFRCFNDSQVSRFWLCVCVINHFAYFLWTYLSQTGAWRKEAELSDLWRDGVWLTPLEAIGVKVHHGKALLRLVRTSLLCDEG